MSATSKDAATADIIEPENEAKSTKKQVNKKKRSIKDIQAEEDSDDQDLEPPESAPRKKRKLNNEEPLNTTNNDDDDDDDENEDDDLKANNSNNKDSKSSVNTDTETAIAEPFKICCYNLNGIRAANKNGRLDKYIEEEDADIVCFSEMKAKLSQNPCKFRGYEIIWYECTEKAGYAGTCILTKHKPLSVTKGIGCEDGQGRAITIEFEKFYLINTYVPNSGQNLKFKKRRLAWDKQMKSWLDKLQQKKPIIWTGDLNVAVLDFDVYDGETNKNRKKSPGFTPYERENFRNMRDELNLIDTYRHFYPNEREKHYTFFTARSRGTSMKKQNKGWRLDYFMVSKSLINIIDGIEIRRDKDCSDHVPLILNMKHPNVALS